MSTEEPIPAELSQITSQALNHSLQSSGIESPSDPTSPLADLPNFREKPPKPISREELHRLRAAEGESPAQPSPPPVPNEDRIAALENAVKQQGEATIKILQMLQGSEPNPALESSKPKSSGSTKRKKKPGPKPKSEKTPEPGNPPTNSSDDSPPQPSPLNFQLEKFTREFREYQKRRDPWKTFRDIEWRTGFYKLDRWPASLREALKNNFEAAIGDDAIVKPLIFLALKIEPNMMVVEKLFRFVCACAGWSLIAAFAPIHQRSETK